MQQAQDQHNQALRQSEEQHQTRLTQLSKPQPQPSKSQPSGAPNGR
jgi:hypothetical protein